MKIKLKNTPEQVELIKAMGSSNKETAMAAQEIFAGFIGPIVNKVLDLAASSAPIFVDQNYDEDIQPSYPLDLFYAANVNEVQVWQQNIPGGLGSSLITGLQELLISTYRLDSAVSLLKRTVRRGQLPYVSLALNRMANELRRKTERNAFLVLLKALGEASTASTKHTIAATVQNILQVNDFSRLITLSQRLNTAFDGAGTPEEVYSKGATDLFMSPEMVEQVRGFAYQPMNTRVPGGSSNVGAVALPDDLREKIFNSAGLAEIYGVAIHNMLEFGDAKRYNQLFGNFATAGIADAGGNFAAATDQLVLGIDLSREACIRPIAQNAETGATLNVQVDDQFPMRSEKLGWVSSLEEGRVVIDARVLTGIIV